MNLKMKRKIIAKSNEKRKQFIDPSRQCYQNDVYFLQNGVENVTYQNFKWTKTNLLNSNGSFLLHIIALHFIMFFLNLKNEPIRIQINVYKNLHCFKDYD